VNILLLSEGDAETWDSWSGSTRSLLEHLRADGHAVTVGDVELRGAGRYLTALQSFAPDRRRWWVRYHLGAEGFRARSRRAARILAALPKPPDVILQIGATFRIPHVAEVRYAVYCDSNIEQAQEGASSGFSEASVLTPDEFDSIRARESDVYQGAARIFTISERLRRSFLDRFGVESGRVETVFAGPNFSYGRAPDVPERPADGAPVILFVGRAFHRKGGDLLVRAFTQVRVALPDARLIVIGPDAPPPEVQQVAGIECLGFIDKDSAEGRQRLLDAYAQARVFCLPTRFEPFGVVFLEAMHYELPVVAPAVWAVPEIVENGVTGKVVPPEDVEALAAALIEMLSDPEGARLMGVAGKRRLEARFTWALVAHRIGRSLESVTSSRTE
jgi:glycosyltransferase involved in cell wall biosynthesis